MSVTVDPPNVTLGKRRGEASGGACDSVTVVFPVVSCAHARACVIQYSIFTVLLSQWRWKWLSKGLEAVTVGRGCWDGYCQGVIW